MEIKNCPNCVSVAYLFQNIETKEFQVICIKCPNYGKPSLDESEAILFWNNSEWCD